MKRVLIVVEGQTEEIFVTRVLQPHLADFDVWLMPTIVETRHLPGKPRDKGGLSSWDRPRRDIQRCLRDTSAHTTTLFDLYGLPDEFPGGARLLGLTPEQEVARRETAMAEDINHARFIPFLALHEFETWLFAAPAAIEAHFGTQGLSGQLNTVVAQFPNIEHINHGRETHPSRRLEKLIPTYKKTSDGPTILGHIGVKQIRSRCAHFDAWLQKLETLA